MITLRLDSQLERSIEATARSIGVSKSELVRQSIVQFLNSREEKSSWELGKELFAKYGSGNSRASVDRKRLISEKVRSKRKKA